MVKTFLLIVQSSESIPGIPDNFPFPGIYSNKFPGNGNGYILQKQRSELAVLDSRERFLKFPELPGTKIPARERTL